MCGKRGGLFAAELLQTGQAAVGELLQLLDILLRQAMLRQQLLQRRNCCTRTDKRVAAAGRTADNSRLRLQAMLLQIFF